MVLEYKINYEKHRYLTRNLNNASTYSNHYSIDIKTDDNILDNYSIVGDQLSISIFKSWLDEDGNIRTESYKLEHDKLPTLFTYLELPASDLLFYLSENDPFLLKVIELRLRKQSEFRKC